MPPLYSSYLTDRNINLRNEEVIINWFLKPLRIGVIVFLNSDLVLMSLDWSNGCVCRPVGF
ncbi:hypothetical protein BCU09_07620 [Vibrio cyclitrophicus]|nr:hypothetical protein OAE_02515 [Vibrio cyclitrophicus 1F289]PMK03825.1 hypothetical protein BCU09_07620 [Vibrio cyclitrophicus]